MSYTVLEASLMTLGIFFLTIIAAVLIMFVGYITAKFFELCDDVKYIKENKK
jgi:hypothetical protein